MPKRRPIPLIKVGNTWWVDTYVNGRRIRRTTGLEKYPEALVKARRLIKQAEDLGNLDKLPITTLSPWI